jgi:uncharacterized protein YggU (UPF0235/DUF167 family)
MAAHRAMCPRHRLSDVASVYREAARGRLRVMGSRRIGVWVRPGASKPGVGGVRDEGAPGETGSELLLVVAVKERAVDGAATAAVLAAVAQAFGVPKRDVSLVSGFTSRRKILSVETPPADFDAILHRLCRSQDVDSG